MSNEQPKIYSAEQMLEIWGLRITGKPFKSCKMLSPKGGSVGVDEAMAIVRYVESVAGFESVRPVLLHVYGAGEDPRTFRLMRPGETFSVALIRNGWFFLHAHRPHKIAEVLLMGFIGTLTNELRAKPFVPPAPMPEEDPGEIGASAGEAIRSALVGRVFSA